MIVFRHRLQTAFESFLPGSAGILEPVLPLQWKCLQQYHCAPPRELTLDGGPHRFPEAWHGMGNDQPMENDDRSGIERVLPSFGPALPEGGGHFVILLAVAVSSVEKFYRTHEAGRVPFEEHCVRVWRSRTRELERNVALLEVSLLDPKVSIPTAGDSDPMPQVLNPGVFETRRLRVRRLADELRPPFFEPSSLRLVQRSLRPLSNVVSQTGEPCPTPIALGIHQSITPERRHPPEPLEGNAGTVLASPAQPAHSYPADHRRDTRHR